jgi:hypothetical protein
MKTKNIASLLLATVLSLGVFGTGTLVRGQQTAPKLTSKQVNALIENAKTPEDYEKLAAYFNQKAASLEAEAKEHKNMANVYHKGKSPVMQNAELCDKAAADEIEAAQQNRAIAESYKKMAEAAPAQ